MCPDMKDEDIDRRESVRLSLSSVKTEFEVVAKPNDLLLGCFKLTPLFGNFI